LLTRPPAGVEITTGLPSEAYETKAACLKEIASVQKNAAAATIEDRMVKATRT
jgi:hypothetical protein